jgi:hypothetical protein
MSTPKGGSEIRNIIAAAVFRGRLAVLITQYLESDPINAQGQIFDTLLDGDAVPRLLLSTNDAITTMWSSPSGHLWAGSSWGYVWTTAPVAWPPVNGTNLHFFSDAPELEWRLMPLPRNAANRRVNVTHIWGIDDSFVVAGDFSGSVFHWNGKEWTLKETPVRREINDIHGLAANEVYAVTGGGELVRFDGRVWKQVPLGKEGFVYPVLTGVRATPDGRVFVAQNRGALFRGAADGLEVAATSTFGLYGVASSADMILMAGMPGGGLAYEEDEGIVQLMDDFQAAGIAEIGRHVAFFPSDQPERPSFVQYTPETDEWIMRSF